MTLNSLARLAETKHLMGSSKEWEGIMGRSRTRWRKLFILNWSENLVWESLEAFKWFQEILGTKTISYK